MKKLKIISLFVILTFLLIFAGSFTQDAHAEEVDLWHYWLAGGEREALESFLGAAQDLYPDYEFTQTEIPGGASDIMRNLGISFVAGDPPEAFQSGIGYGLRTFTEAERLMPLDDVWEEVNAEEVFPAGLNDLVRFDDHAWAIPLNMHVISHVFYDKQIFNEYDLDPPETWEEYKEISELLREEGIQPMAAAAGWTNYNFYTILINELGTEKYLDLGRGKTSFEDPEVISAFETFKDTWIDSYMEGWSGYDWSEAADRLMDEDVAMYGMGDWVVAFLEGRGWEPGEDFGFFPAPETDDHIFIQVDSFAAPGGSANPEGAKKLMKAAASVEGQRAFNRYKGSVAAHKDVPTDIYNPIMEETYYRFQDIEERDGAHVMPNLQFYMPPEFYEEFDTQIEIFSMEPTEETLEQVIEELEDLRHELIAEDAFVDWPPLGY